MEKAVNNLTHLSNQELIDIYNGVSSMKEKAIKELNSRGVFYKKGNFTKPFVKTAKQIEMFLRSAGFEYLASLPKNGNYHASGCAEYVKPIDNLYSYQINGEGLSEIKSIHDAVIFSENGSDPSVIPTYRHHIHYSNFIEMINGEKHRGIFNEALKNYNI